MKIKKIVSICFIFFALIFCFNFVNAIKYSVNITVNEDAYVYNNSADTNYGNSVDLYVRDNGEPERYDTNLEYIINDIPDRMEIDSVSLCLYSDWINGSGKNITIYYLTHSFLENTIKWERNYRQYINYNYNVSYEFNNSGLDKYTCIDVTDLLSYAYSEEEPLLDLIIIGSDNTTGSVKFNSKENTYPSYVEVNYSTDYSGTDNELWCKYNALKGGTISTCNNFKVGAYCDEIIDEHITGDPPGSHSEWITDDGFTVPPNIAHFIVNMDEPFYFDRVEVWGRTVGVNKIQPKAYEISVYSDETETWYLLLNETDAYIKDGWVNLYGFGGVGTPFATGMVPYIKNIDTIYLGNLSISKVQLKVYDTLATVDFELFMNELAFCVMEESESVIDTIDYTIAEIGSGCDTDDDCECQLCEYGFCVLRTTGMNCIINGTSRDDCCLSGECSNGKCTKTGLWSGIEASKNQQFGDDADTNNFLALFFIIGTAGFLMYYGNIIAGIFALYMLSIFFVLIGWLSPFLLLGMVITGLIAVMFRVVTGGNQG